MGSAKGRDLLAHLWNAEVSLSHLSPSAPSCWILFCCANPREMHRADIHSLCPKQRIHSQHPGDWSITSPESCLTAMTRGRENKLTFSIAAAQSLPLFLFNEELSQPRRRHLTVIQWPFLGGGAPAFIPFCSRDRFYHLMCYFCAFFDM